MASALSNPDHGDHHGDRWVYKGEGSNAQLFSNGNQHNRKFNLGFATDGAWDTRLSNPSNVPDLNPAPGACSTVPSDGSSVHESKYSPFHIPGLSTCNKANLNPSSSSDRSSSVEEDDTDDEATPYSIKRYLAEIEDLDTSEGEAFSAPSPTTFKVRPDLVVKVIQAKLVIWRQNAKVGGLTVTLGANVDAVVSLEGVFSIQGLYWSAPKDDDTIPTTPEQKIALVKDLIDAIKTNRNCKEVVDKHFLTRWGDEATYYKWVDIEPLAWDILEFMVDIHEHGWTVPIYDRELREFVQQTMFFTFQDRFQTLCQLLQYEKSSCEDLLKGDRWNSIIGNPYMTDGRSSNPPCEATAQGGHRRKRWP